jgi:aldose sugar dehydrogenase
LTRVALLIGIGVTATIITLLFVLMFETVIKKGEGRAGPKISNQDKQFMKIEIVADGLSFPTSMEFIDNENILVLEKDHGTVRLVSSLNGTLEEEPVLKVNVENEAERGLLGVAVLNDDIRNKKYSINNDSTNTGPANNKGKPRVFLYFTEKSENENKQQFPRNKVLSYEWNRKNNSLINSNLILNLPAVPGPYHQGGKLKIGPDENLYVIIGDLNTITGQLQNDKNGTEPNNSSVILRVNPDNGYPVEDNPFVYIDGLSRYYAYGIRNSFGIDFDPATGNLWDTENGEHDYDEINLVKPGFNSGWAKIMGPVSRNNNNITQQENLVAFPGSLYSDPVFSWKEQVGITDIEFLNSTKLGTEYANNIFVGDINNGNLYYFEVNDNRTGLNFGTTVVDEGKYDNKRYTQAELQDLVADSKDEFYPIIFGTGFGRITDIETGPDGFLYVLSYEDGKIYRIINKKQ